MRLASVAMTNGALLAADGSGAVTVATSTTNNIVGVSTRVVAATDADYAASTEVGVIMPNDNAVFQMDVTGTLTAAMVGNAYDLSDAYTVNVGATAKKVVTCVGFISATQGLFKINSRESDVNHA
jgi:RNase P/RNase MRP subunit p29